MHEWENQWNSESIPSLQEFLPQKIYDKYTTLSASDIIQYMNDYPELYIIIDTKETDQIEVTKDLIGLSSYNTDITDRFIIQLYDAGIKSQMQKLYPFKDENFLFTAYKFGAQYPNKIMDLCYKENISVITIPYGTWDAETKEFFASKGFIIYEHTVNRPDYAHQSLAQGVHGFYTDFLTEEDLNLN